MFVNNEKTCWSQPLNFKVKAFISCIYSYISICSIFVILKLKIFQAEFQYYACKQ